MHDYYVYIMTNYSGTLYIGITNDLTRRVFEHKNKLIDGFTRKYNINRLVYHEHFQYILNAIAREKQLKRWRRKKKLWIINTINPSWTDLALELIA